MSAVLIGVALIGVAGRVVLRSRARAKCDRCSKDRTLELEMSARRQATACDFRPGVSEAIETLVTEARAALHERAEMLESGRLCRLHADTDARDTSGYHSYVLSIEALLVEQLAILPPLVFGVMCEVRNAVVAFEVTDDLLTESCDAEIPAARTQRLAGQAANADRLYGALVDEVQSFFATCVSG